MAAACIEEPRPATVSTCTEKRYIINKNHWSTSKFFTRQSSISHQAKRREEKKTYKPEEQEGEPSESICFPHPSAEIPIVNQKSSLIQNTPDDTGYCPEALREDELGSS
jgi:hypothetical protein